MKCRECGSEHLVKYGKNASGEQRHQCKKCFSITVENQKHTKMSQAEKDLALKIYKEGVSICGIARILGRSFYAVYLFLKKNAKENL